VTNKQLILFFCSIFFFLLLAPVRDVKAVVGGNPVGNINNYPWMGSFDYEASHPSCGVTLVANNWALTAKHCVDDPANNVSWEEIQQLTPIVRFSSLDMFSGGNTFAVETVVTHSSSDLALLKLTQSPAVPPVTIATDNSLNYVNNNVTLLGWGGLNNTVHSTLQQLSTPIVNPLDCAVSPSSEWICVGNFDGQSAVKRDSGGPLLAIKNGQWVQIGVASGGYADCVGSNTCPSHYTNIAPFYNWINDVIDSQQGGQGKVVVYNQDNLSGDSRDLTYTVNFGYEGSSANFGTSSLYIANGWSAFITNGRDDYLCASTSLWDLDQDYYHPNPGMKIHGDIAFIITYNDTSCGGVDQNNDGVLDNGIQFQEPQSATVHFYNGGSSGGSSSGGGTPTPPSTGHAKLYSLSNYANPIGNYGLGSHSFAPNTYIHSVDLEGAGSFIVYANDGRSRCFSEDIPNLQDHEEWWKDTIRMDVYGNNVCPTPNSGAYVEIWQAANYGGNKLGNYYVGTHTFAPDTLMYAVRMKDGAQSFVVHAADGRSRCFTGDMPTLQDHEEWMRETIRMDVYDTDVCEPFDSNYYTGIIGEWNFDNMDGTRVLNTAGYGDIFVSNTSVVGAGLHGNGLIANGTDYAFKEHPEGGLNPNNDHPFSISFWIQGQTTSGLDYRFLSNINTGGGYDAGWWLRMDKSTGNLTYFYGKNEGPGYNHATGLGITGLLDGQPHHVVITFTGMNGGKTIRTYKDGVRVDDKMISGGGDISYNGYMYLYVAHTTVATVDELKIYRSTLTQSEVMDLYLTDTPNLPSPPQSQIGLAGHWDFETVNGTTIVDSSGHNNLVASNASVIDATGIFSNSLQTNGVEYVSVTNPSAALRPGDSDPFSVEFWIDGNSSIGVDYQFLSNIQTDTNDAGWWLRMEKSAGQLTYFYGKGGPGQNHATGLAISGLLDGNPHHVVVTFTGMNGGKTIRTYKDSILVDNTAIVGGDPIAYHNNMAFFIAKNTQANVDNVKVYNRILTAEEVATHFLDGIILLPLPGSQPSDIATDWPYSQTLTIDHTLVANDLVNFPVFVSGDVLSDHLFSTMVTETYALPNSGVDLTGLAGYWNFDEEGGSTFADQVGVNDFLTTNDSVIGNNGVFGNGITTDGTNYAYIPNTTNALKPGDNSPFSISFWVQGQGVAGGDLAFLSNMQNPGSNDVGWWFRMDQPTGHLWYYYAKNGIGQNHATGLAIDNLLDGKLHHVVITLTGMNGSTNKTIRTYKDGVLIDNKIVSGGGSIQYHSNMALYLAKLTGVTIDDLAIFNRVLAASEVQTIYQGNANYIDARTMRITSDSQGFNELPFEVVSFNPNRYEAEIWVKTDVSATTDTKLYVWYGNALADARPSNHTYGSGSVWSEFGVRNHFNGTTADSTLQYKHADTVGISFVQNAVGEGIKSTGGTDFGLKYGNNFSVSTGDARWSFWLETNSPTAGDVIFSKGQSVLDGYYFQVVSGNALRFTSNQNGTSQAVLTSSTLSNNVSHKIDVIKNGNTISIYIDGVEAAYSGSQTINTPTSNSKDFYLLRYNLGSQVGYSLELPAKLDEFAFQAMARTPDWIQTEFVNQSDPAAFFGNEIPERILPSYIASNWPYSQTITIDHTQVAGDLTDFPVLITGDVITDHVFTTLPSQTKSFLESGVSTANLAGYWTFDETSGTTFADYLGANNLTASTAAAVGSPGVFGNGLSANGYAYKTNTTSALKPGNETDFSVSFWVQGSGGSGTDYSFLSNIHTNSTDAGWWLAMNKPGGSFTYFYGKNGSGLNHATGLSVYPLLDGNLHHVVVTFTGMNGGKIIKTYRDGVLIDNKAIAAVGANIAYHSTMSLRVAYATGAMVDDLAILNRTLSAAEVQQIYAGNTPQADTSSIRFTSDAEGFQELPFEIVSLDPISHEAEIWVQSDLSSTTDTSIYLWYGNEDAQAYGATATFGSRAVWSSYKAVYHNPFHQTDSTGTYTLSSVGSNGPTSTDGAILSGTDYGTVKHSTSGSSLSRAQKVGNDMGIQGGSYTIQMLVRANGNITGSGTNIDGLLAITDAQSDWRPMIYTAAKNGASLIFNQSGIGGGTTGSLTIPNPIGTVEYEYLTLTYNGSLLRAYHDGVEIGSMTVTGTPVGGFNPYDGVIIGGVPGWNGIDQLYDSLHDIDEVRISAQVKSPEWITTESNVLKSPETFFITP